MQRRKLALFVVILSLSIHSRILGQENLIQNGSFETPNENLPAMWETHSWKQDPNIAKFYGESTGAHLGERYITIENIKPDDSKLIQHVKVKPNTLYKLSCWIKAEGIQENQLGANISALGILETSTNVKDTGGNWQYIELYGKTGPEQKRLSVTARLGGYGRLSKGKASFDDFRLAEIGAAPPGVRIINLFPSEQARTPPKQKPPSFMPTILFVSLLFLILCAFCYSLIRQNILEKMRERSITINFFIILALSLLFRLLFATTIEGYPNDIACFKGWAIAAANRGLLDFYHLDMFRDYPPGYMYVLYAIGLIQKIFGLNYQSSAFLIFIKLPSILSDILCAFLIYRLSSRFISKKHSALLGILYAFNPMVFFNSTFYGQVDSFFTLFIFLMIYFFTQKRFVLSAIFFSVSVAVKPQGLIFSPICLFFIFHWFLKTVRYLYRKPKDKQEVEERNSMKKQGIVVGCSLIAAVAVFILLILPFSLKDPFVVFKVYKKALSSYPYSSLNAFNLFTLFGKNWDDQNNLFFLLSYKTWGILFTVLITIFCGFLYFKGKHRYRPTLIALVLITGVFTLSAKMHERYLYPAVILSLMSYFFTKDRRFLFLFLGKSLSSFINQGMVLDFMINQNLSLIPANHFLLKAFSLVNVVLFGYTIKVCFDIGFKNRVIPIQSSIMPLHGQGLKKPLEPEAEKEPLNKKDWLLMGGLTAVYTLIALINLGSFKAPQSYWSPGNQGESFYVDFGHSYTIDRMYYFFGIGQGKYKIEFSKNGSSWTDPRSIEQKSRYDMIEWRYLTLHIDARYAKITAERPGLYLNEIGFFEQGKTKPMKIEEIKSLTSTSATIGSPNALFDEQNTIAYVPGYFNGMYFDEIYHARTAYEHIHGIPPSETTHPPLGKLIIALGILIFGMTPFGWRFSGTFLGILMVPLMYLFGKRLFQKSEYAFISSFLFTFDFMHFVQTRIATIDVYGLFFIILMYYFMYEYFRLNFYSTPLKKTLIPLLFSGIFFGMGSASKWIGLYAGLGLAALFFSVMAKRFVEYLKASSKLKEKKERLTKSLRHEYENIKRKFMPHFAITILCCILFFIIIPSFIYFLSYTPILVLPGHENPVGFVINDQKHMFDYHSKLQATHPFSSNWWEWPIMKRPIWYFGGQNYLPPDKISTIASFGNPAVWWVGIVAVVAATVFLIYQKNPALYFILVALAAQYLPWIVVPRDLVFIYHFFATVPFMVFCITYLLLRLNERFKWFRYVMYGYLAAVFILFVMFYPILSGMVVNKTYAATFLKWFNNWIFFI